MERHKIDLKIPDSTLGDWQDIADILAEMVDIPAALVMRYIEPDIKVFVSSRSEGNPYKPGDSEKLFGSGLYCETVIKSDNKLLVPDALSDEHWKSNPDVKLNMISYLGFPIKLPNSQPFGTLCVLDNKPNGYSSAVEKLMVKFRNLLESQLEMIYMNHMLGDEKRELSDYLKEIQALRGIVPICSSCKSIRDEGDNWNPIEKILLKHPEAEFSHSLCPDCVKKLYPNLNKDKA